MSRKKALEIRGRRVWVYDSSHDVVIAHMIECVLERGCPPWLSDAMARWRAAASVADISIQISADEDATHYDFLQRVVADVRARVVRHGDVRPSDLASWSVLEGECVSGGLLREETLACEALVDVIDAFDAMLAGTLPPDPPSGHWFIGAPGGRRTIGVGAT